jgi:tetratricopeptide (TPR) repeat protein
MRGAGTHWPEMFDYLNDIEGIAWRGYFGTIDLVKRCIDSRMPVITTEYYGMSGHALAITGYDDAGQLLIAQDPRFLEPVEIPYKTFERSWEHDDGLCIAVAPAKDRKKLPGQSGDEERLVREYIELLRLRNDGEEDAAMRKALELSNDAPEKQSPLRIMSEVALKRRALPQLQQLCQEAINRWPHCFWAHRYIGDALWMQDDPVKALAHYRKARRLDNRDPALAYAMGELLLSKSRRNRARTRLMQALRSDPRYLRARLRLAEDLAETGDTELATFHARLLVEFDPEHTAAKELLAKLSGNTVVMRLSEAARKVADEVAERQANAAEQMQANAQAAEDDTQEVEIDLDDI